jgi:hypothetical protein
MLYWAYVTKGMTMREASDRLEIPLGAVARSLERWSIPVRPTGPKATADEAPARHAKGHYVYLARPGHPRADRHGRVQRSLVAWETENGPFPEGMIPHHKNFVKDDDRPENVRPMTPRAHRQLHGRLLGRPKSGQ